MKYLLDTHSLLWLATNSPKLSQTANNTVAFTTISLWELGIKASIGKLDLQTTPEKLERRAVKEGLHSIPLTAQVVSRVMTLPWHHKDTFDRILVATALVEGAGLISKDPLFKDYGVTVRW